MKVFDSLLETIGSTPMIRLRRIEQNLRVPANLFAKVEAFNPGGSIKDRIALAMIEAQERRGKLAPGATIIEPSSGNTGIGLAMVGAIKGYRVVIVMSDTASVERRKILELYGARVILSDGAKGIQEAIRIAKELARNTPGSFMPMQFANSANPRIHYRTTAREIWKQMDGRLDVFVAGIGTGGTISGVGRYLREHLPSVQIIGLEPADSPVLTKGCKGSHKIQGIGAGFIPKTLNQAIYDEIITVTNAQAYAHARLLARHEGILAGISAGAALYGALAVGTRGGSASQNIVMVLPDTGERYLSTDLAKFD